MKKESRWRQRKQFYLELCKILNDEEILNKEDIKRKKQRHSGRKLNGFFYLFQQY